MYALSRRVWGNRVAKQRARVRYAIAVVVTRPNLLVPIDIAGASGFRQVCSNAAHKEGDCYQRVWRGTERDDRVVLWTHRGLCVLMI